MQEIGTWSTQEGSSTAMLQFEAGVDDVNAQELPGWLTGALQGAAAGAMTGAAAGPYGALIGAGVGGALGAATSATAPPPASAPAAPQPAAPSSPSQPAAAPSAPATAGQPPDGRADVIRALQQFAAIVPTLVQLVAADGKRTKEAQDGAGESLEAASWDAALLEGYWSVP